MPAVVLTGIGLLCTQTAEYGDLPDAALLIENGRVAWVGPVSSVPEADEQVDLGGRCVLPGFVDSHAHLVFAGDRSA
ncbi:MAG: imidazolonepropionase, partial [Actinomycetota bacterium]|nr:imidazolonepropionase [Actinomycetota bacterium]